MISGKGWADTFFTYIWIFNTGRGLSVFVRLPQNVGIIYDLGSSEDFSPCEFLSRHIVPRLTSYGNFKVGQLVISHPHADHIAELDCIRDRTRNPALYPYFLTCPNDKEPAEAVDFSGITNADNRVLMESYRDLFRDRNPPLQTLGNLVRCTVPNVEYGIYYMRPPEVAKLHPGDAHKYGNGMSLVLYLRHGNQTILVPGDITPEVFSRVLDGGAGVEKRYTIFGQQPQGNDWSLQTADQPTLRQLLGARGLSVLVAPHHGLESCFSQELFQSISGGRSMLNVISEKKHWSDGDGQVDSRYQGQTTARGTSVDIEGNMERQRYSVSTRDGHHILIVFRGTDAAPRIYLRKRPEDLLNVV